MAKFLFDIAHPKHYHQFRHVIGALERDHEVSVMARDKDIVLELLDAAGVEYRPYSRHRSGLLRKVLALPRALVEYAGALRVSRPDVIVSKSSPYAAVLGRYFGAVTVVMPDSEGVMVNEWVVIPRSDFVITPETFERDYGRKHLRVHGVFEAAYLHPSYFVPDGEVLRELCVGADEPFSVLRFVAWTANHDFGQQGMTDAQKVDLVNRLAQHLRVFIVAENALPPALEPLRIPIPAARLHDALAYAALYVGDSQTMATEAGLLGTPAVRYNSFVGLRDFSNFRILEQEFGLLRNCASFDQALGCAVELATDPDAKRTWGERRMRYFASAGDVNADVLRHLDGIVGSIEPADGGPSA